ncbi:MAG: carboxypeptidase-like regulatory domain-containing protein, partial [Bryobacteraceae bacterium]
MSARKTLLVPSFWMMTLLLLWPSVSPGQITTATISGRITDASGSPVPQVNVIATNEATGITHTATTTEDGQYLLPLLPIAGSYSIEAERKDFQRYAQRNILLRVNENVRVDITLKVGETSQTVEVSATPAQIETRETSLGEVIEQRRMVELPLNGRNPIQLASLVAGVTQITAPTVYTWRGGSYLSVSGSRVNENDYLLDGV